jgi:excisionase family DNA binding protein
MPVYNPFEEIIQKLCDLQKEVRMIRLESVVNTQTMETFAMDDGHVTADVIAMERGWAKSTVLRYARMNVIPSYKAGKSYTFKRSEVDKAISSQTPLKRKKKGESKP